uniref:Cytochrome c oxidase assembly protein COX19 n=1 Tax=Culicoides sonorensis TaxID=179676 RepID=A0A336MTA4_CULSO
MSSMTFNQKKFTPVPPQKGSFPLDHFNECKKQMLSYMHCLASNKDDNSKCRVQSKEYIECRMEHNLMAKEDLKNLGFKDLIEKEEKSDSVNKKISS